jgi:Anthrone oxygenase
MRDALRPWTIVMLSAGGLFSGGLVWYAWERVWIWRRLDLGAFAVDFRRSVRKADPAMPILLVICAAAAGMFASLAEGGARTLALAGIGLLVVILVGSIVVAEPINSQFRRLPEGVVPPQAERLRRRWRRFHLIRTCMGVAALACFITAVTYTAPG